MQSRILFYDEVTSTAFVQGYVAALDRSVKLWSFIQDENGHGDWRMQTSNVAYTFERQSSGRSAKQYLVVSQQITAKVSQAHQAPLPASDLPSNAVYGQALLCE